MEESTRITLRNERSDLNIGEVAHEQLSIIVLSTWDGGTRSMADGRSGRRRNV